jgi:hypothetical protein
VVEVADEQVAAVVEEEMRLGGEDLIEVAGTLYRVPRR